MFLECVPNIKRITVLINIYQKQEKVNLFEKLLSLHKIVNIFCLFNNKR
jgi:hypothetical protein